MATVAPSKYALKSLHEEIALFDRKLAHLEKYETFPTEDDRVAATAKLSLKRSKLVRAAQAMSDAGIEADHADMTSASIDSSEGSESRMEANWAPAITAADVRVKKAANPVHSSSVLDFRNSIDEYKKRRKVM